MVRLRYRKVATLPAIPDHGIRLGFHEEKLDERSFFSQTAKARAQIKPNTYFVLLLPRCLPLQVRQPSLTGIKETPNKPPDCGDVA
jgi:hypothetical protein